MWGGECVGPRNSVRGGPDCPWERGSLGVLMPTGY